MQSRDRTSWPYLSAPLAAYLAVMIPICLLEFFLFVTDSPLWMRATAGAVIGFSVFGFFRGYMRRLVLTPESARLIRLGGPIEIAWSRVAHIGTYVPDGGVGSTDYVYITTRAGPPGGKWDLGPEVIQLQNRPGLLEAVERMSRGAAAPPTDGRDQANGA